MSNTNHQKLRAKARSIRRSVVEMLYHAQSGHPGGALSATDILTALYFGGVLKHFPDPPFCDQRDVFVLSVGHYCPVLYACLAHAGYFPIAELRTLRKSGSRLKGHPKYRVLPGIENTSGSLGQGISIALGVAKAWKIERRPNRVYCVMGDGEQNEGQVWEAALFASHHRLDNLCAIVDANKVQLDGFTDDVMTIEPLVAKYQSFGWHALRIDGHDFEAILEAFAEASIIKGRPTVLIADTIAGKGLSFLEGTVQAHGMAIRDSEYALAMEELS
ncbi:MAG: transketolase [Planctomycetes bacterium]|nr:transketolase [Planctomycetota bacterium]